MSETSSNMFTQEDHVKNLDEYAEDVQLNRASVFLEDAEKYRFPYHKIDRFSLRVQRVYYSSWITMLSSVSLFVVLCLPFFEYPSSFSMTSNVLVRLERFEFPSPLILCVECVCLVIITSRAACKMFLIGKYNTLRDKWFIVLLFTIVVSFCDFCIEVIILKYTRSYRIRRFLRPVFMLHNSTLMKKILKSLLKTLPEMLNALFLLGLWLFSFTIIGMSVFSDQSRYIRSKQDGGSDYFTNFFDTMYNLIVLLSTANNPDVMIKPYNENRINLIFFVAFVGVGLFILMSLMIAIIFNQFRGHLLESMQSMHLRRRIAMRAAFEVLKEASSANYHNLEEQDVVNGVDPEIFRKFIEHTHYLPQKKSFILKRLTLFNNVLEWTHFREYISLGEHSEYYRKVRKLPHFSSRFVQKFQNLFISRPFDLFGICMCIANVLVIAVDICIFYNVQREFSLLTTINWAFLAFYIFETIVKIWALGYRLYFSQTNTVFEFCITVVILMIKVLEVILLHKKEIDFLDGIRIWDLPRISNLFILIRAARILHLFVWLTPITSTLIDLPSRLKPLLGIFFCLFYFFCLLGFELFGNRMNNKQFTGYSRNETFFNKSFECGTFQQLSYWAVNFDDFYASLGTMWTLMIVNNWQVITEGLVEAAGNNKWVRLFSINWWIISQIFLLNITTAFIFEIYMHHREDYEKKKSYSSTFKIRSHVPPGHFGDLPLSKYDRYSLRRTNTFSGMPDTYDLMNVEGGGREGHGADLTDISAAQIASHNVNSVPDDISNFAPNQLANAQSNSTFVHFADGSNLSLGSTAKLTDDNKFLADSRAEFTETQSFRNLFRDDLAEPSEKLLLSCLMKHHQLCKMYPRLKFSTIYEDMSH